ncbi:MAG: hypothetical protein IKT73_00835 [Anaerotignum sp.]|nr:hypothetical protein [Lachnospiraceae bacterium]MBR6541730.1 hypothetical protein [Anaerotignum sp.]
MVEVDYAEYIALKKRVEELERKQVKDVPLASGWAYAVTELPIHHLGIDKFCSVKHPVVTYKRGAYDAWKLFTSLAKQIHAVDTLHFTSCNSRYNGEQYRWRIEYHSAPRSHTALTYEQKLLSLEMLNELVPIYNKYYKLAHPEADFFDVTGKVFSLQIVDEKDGME